LGRERKRRRENIVDRVDNGAAAIVAQAKAMLRPYRKAYERKASEGLPYIRGSGTHAFLSTDPLQRQGAKGRPPRKKAGVGYTLWGRVGRL